jgi:hypothetical protein
MKKKEKIKKHYTVFDIESHLLCPVCVGNYHIHQKWGDHYILVVVCNVALVAHELVTAIRDVSEEPHSLVTDTVVDRKVPRNGSRSARGDHVLKSSMDSRKHDLLQWNSGHFQHQLRHGARIRVSVTTRLGQREWQAK